MQHNRDPRLAIIQPAHLLFTDEDLDALAEAELWFRFHADVDRAREAVAAARAVPLDLAALGIEHDYTARVA